ncbi:hypothetical protein LTR40_014761, partial [Exophiala xenobiotica]
MLKDLAISAEFSFKDFDSTMMPDDARTTQRLNPFASEALAIIDYFSIRSEGAQHELQIGIVDAMEKSVER